MTGFVLQGHIYCLKSLNKLYINYNKQKKSIFLITGSKCPIANTYDADARLQISRDAEVVEDPLVRRVAELHLIQLQDRRRQLLKAIRKTVERSEHNSRSLLRRVDPSHKHTRRRSRTDRKMASDSLTKGLSSGL